MKLSDARDQIDMFYGRPLEVMASCMRGFITAAPGKRLIACDFSSIESRVLAWLANEKRKIQIFNTHGLVYEDVAAGIFNVPMEEITKEDPRRQTGKVGELAFGFGGGKGAYLQMARGFGIDATEEEAERAKIGWRKIHPETVAYWSNLQEASVEAVRHAGKKISVGPAYAKVVYLHKGSFLFCQLPSKRIITYPYPELREQVWVTFTYSAEEDGETVWKETGKYFNGKTFDLAVRTAKAFATKHVLKIKDAKPSKAVVSYMSEDSTTRRFTRHGAYSGLLCENITQATSRDLLAEAMLRLDKAGYHIITHVHDEVVCEEEPFFGSLEEVREIMCELPEWATGLPIAADGWVGSRYRK